jgi:hypothetical protein
MGLMPQRRPDQPDNIQRLPLTVPKRDEIRAWESRACTADGSGAVTDRE